METPAQYIYNTSHLAVDVNGQVTDIDALKGQIHDLKADLERWQRIAAYLVECHCATLEAAPKRTSKYARQRFTSILSKSIGFLNGTLTPSLPWSAASSTQIRRAINRCERTIREYGSDQELR